MRYTEEYFKSFKHSIVDNAIEYGYVESEPEFGIPVVPGGLCPYCGSSIIGRMERRGWRWIMFECGSQAAVWDRVPPNVTLCGVSLQADTCKVIAITEAGRDDEI